MWEDRLTKICNDADVLEELTEDAWRKDLDMMPFEEIHQKLCMARIKALEIEMKLYDVIVEVRTFLPEDGEFDKKEEIK